MRFKFQSGTSDHGQPTLGLTGRFATIVETAR
jgi:hypothetical protein